jgi:hypothetical protein
MMLPSKISLQSIPGSIPTQRGGLRPRLAGKSSGTRFLLAALASLLLLPSSGMLFAQTLGQNPTEPDGVTGGGYQIHSSLEVGGRAVGVTGSGDMYDTLVNLRTGPRIFFSTALAGAAIRTTLYVCAQKRTSGTTCKAASGATSISPITTCWRIR